MLSMESSISLYVQELDFKHADMKHSTWTVSQFGRKRWTAELLAQYTKVVLTK
jgi:hypothetical protein